MVQVKIKWGKNEYDIEVEDESVDVFKAQVYTETNVPPERQKYTGFPGGMLKDTDNILEKAQKLKPGAKVMLIGTAEGGELKKPTEKIVFEEDLTPEEKAKLLKEKKVEMLPPGMKNLGNTCYMNSCVQCLSSIPDLRTALESYDAPAAQGRDQDTVLTSQFKTVAQMLKGTTEAITPLPFVVALRERFPRFAEMQNGGYMQQDADECMRGLLTVLSQTLTSESGNKIDDLFSFNMKSTLKCLECDEEPPQENIETTRVLMCHLGTPTEPVSHIHQGIALSMKEHIEKNSPVLGRNAQYEKASSLASLPSYLVVQFARFGYKGANDWAGTTASKVKLTRKCAFSHSFDAFDLASDELKKKLSVGRLKKKEQDDAALERERAKLGKGGNSSSSSAKPADGDVEMKDAEADVEMSPPPGEELDTGYYELIAIVSHKGRTADGGHYVGWVKFKKADGKENKEDTWILFDDETTSFETWNNMVGLSTDLQGGKVDTQIAYINIYRKITVKDQGNVLGSGEEKKEEAKAA
mmetsp:Transcript_6094/g.14151  ORF Transcript_6094/g.14151 Transcript_6094/m.14151 type:complete len:525 (+) Transcript_6094:165-1739(+)|eukprot:CAMPEP_0206453414 /NCGR_PEP_ID=MMETSP0324_2-20121206/20531_1 /ASSEMBLY_ACC=CAM_ASM_000836 /TAXON_ID=2866 /ORGANISM="Crypthecodinium cohnii, Strain Seligo" /LENGTH=524 /DNA_ID=CAMNT_0053923699 /DNA_START=165 /DNA_END=1739 /DNA_ORIENTATION=+